MGARPVGGPDQRHMGMLARRHIHRGAGEEVEPDRKRAGILAAETRVLQLCDLGCGNRELDEQRVLIRRQRIDPGFQIEDRYGAIADPQADEVQPVGETADVVDPHLHGEAAKSGDDDLVALLDVQQMRVDRGQGIVPAVLLAERGHTKIVVAVIRPADGVAVEVDDPGGWESCKRPEEKLE